MIYFYKKFRGGGCAIRVVSRVLQNIFSFTINHAYFVLIEVGTSLYLIMIIVISLVILLVSYAFISIAISYINSYCPEFYISEILLKSHHGSLTMISLFQSVDFYAVLSQEGYL